MTYAFDAFVTAALFDASSQAWFALGDGTVRREDGLTFQAHQGAVLCAAVHPTGSGILTGGDDGVLAWTRESGVEVLETTPGRWVDAVTASSASGLVAWACGKRVEVRDAADPDFRRSFEHERSAADLAFDPRGRRLAVATYDRVISLFDENGEQRKDKFSTKPVRCPRGRRWPPPRLRSLRRHRRAPLRPKPPAWRG